MAMSAISVSFINHALCTLDDPKLGYRDFSSPRQNDKFCWNDSLTFSGRPYAVNPDICTNSGECISQYRIHDGTQECYDGQDEIMLLDKNYCTGNVGRHRFQCFNDEHKCLPLRIFGVGRCSNKYDRSWYGSGADLRLQFPCHKEQKTDCHLMKAYIQQSSTWNSSYNSSLVNSQQQVPMDRMPFRFYCDSFWNLDKHVDEMPSSCQYWICQNNQYQCRTGQCIDFNWVCDGEWDCSDASDEEAIFLVEKPSIHNARLPNLLSQLENVERDILNHHFRTSVIHPLNLVVIYLEFQIHSIFNRIDHVLILLRLVIIWKIVTMPMMKKTYSQPIRTYKTCGVSIFVAAMII
jgi:hypothetical protein